MYRIKLLFILLFVFSFNLFPQNIKDLLYKIDLKLKNDKTYLNLHYVEHQFTGQIDRLLKSVPRTEEKLDYEFKSSPELTYLFVFLYESIEFDSLVLLYVDEITDKAVADTSSFTGGEISGPTRDTVRVLDFRDMYNITLNHPDIYAQFMNIIRKSLVGGEKPKSILGINVDQNIQTSMGIASRNNRDYLNFVYANFNHWYPKPAPKTTGRRGAQQQIEQSPFRIDAGFSGFSFSHEVMSFALSGGSVEFNVQSKVINLLPWQTQSFNLAFRTLISLSGEETKDLYDRVYIDLKAIGRVATNLNKVSKSLPFLSSINGQNLNVGTAAGLDLVLTRPFSLPFINIFILTGGSKFSSPSIKATDTTAYYTFTEAEATMSFFWNADESFTIKMRADIGFGYFDVWEGLFKNAKAKNPAKKILIKDDIQPVAAFYLNFSPQGTDMLGFKARLFDSRITLSSWLQIAKIADQHVIRFEAIFLSDPFGRKAQAWEVESSVFFQLKYRLGL